MPLSSNLLLYAIIEHVCLRRGLSRIKTPHPHRSEWSPDGNNVMGCGQTLFKAFLQPIDERRVTWGQGQGPAIMPSSQNYSCVWKTQSSFNTGNLVLIYTLITASDLYCSLCLPVLVLSNEVSIRWVMVIVIIDMLQQTLSGMTSNTARQASALCPILKRQWQGCW